MTPVVKLDGLLRIYEWLRAMEQFNKDGDYGAFGALLTREGLPGKLLTDAAFLERIANAPDARRKFDSFAQSPQQAESADEQLGRATQEHRMRPGEIGNFITLKNLRNSLAHGTRSEADTVRDLIRDENRLAEWLEKSFAKLLPK